MGANTIDWRAVFEQAHADALNPDESLDAFLRRAQDEFRSLYICDAKRKAMEAAGCHGSGTRYFKDLFAENESVTPTDQLRSAFIGSVAYAHVDTARQAYSHLVASQKIITLNVQLINQLTAAQKTEQAQNICQDRALRLKAAACTLGQALVNYVNNEMTNESVGGSKES